jgi:hypothetical protein
MGGWIDRRRAWESGLPRCGRNFLVPKPRVPVGHPGLFMGVPSGDVATSFQRMNGVLGALLFKSRFSGVWIKSSAHRLGSGHRQRKTAALPFGAMAAVVGSGWDFPQALAGFWGFSGASRSMVLRASRRWASASRICLRMLRLRLVAHQRTTGEATKIVE